MVVIPAERLPSAVERSLMAATMRLTDWLAGDGVRTIYQSPLVRTNGDESI